MKNPVQISIKTRAEGLEKLDLYKRLTGAETVAIYDREHRHRETYIAPSRISPDFTTRVGLSANSPLKWNGKLKITLIEE